MLGRLFTAIGAFFNKIIRAIWKQDPVAVYQLKIDQATDKIKSGQTRLAEFKGHVNRLERQLAEDQKQVNIYQARVDAALQTGNDQKANDADVALQKAETQRDNTAAQLATFKKQYDQQVAMIKASRQTIIQAQEECKTMGLKLKMSQANKEAAKLASEFADDMGNPLSDLAEIRSEINDQIDANNAVAEVNTDLGIGGASTAAAEEEDFQKMQASSRLAARKAALGLGPKAEAPSAPKQLPEPAEVVEGQVVAINGVRVANQ